MEQQRPAVIGFDAHRELWDLLDSGFPGLAPRIRRAYELGWAWHEVSTAFVERVGGRPVSHTGVLELPMIVGGERLLAAGIHAVCTRPEHRRQGLNRSTMERALAHVDARTETAILTTVEPHLYERYGFRAFPEHLARVPRTAPWSRPLRRLGANEADLALLRRVLAAREPVSERLWVVEPGGVFVTDEILGMNGIERLHYAEDLDAVLAIEVADGRLQLLDVAAPTLPGLDALAAHLPADFDTFDLMFCPDKLAPDATRVRASYDGAVPMVRGRWPLPADEPVMLAPLSRC